MIGANSFGTVSDGSDAEFFFAVAMPEILRFLHDNHVTPHLSALPCQSMDDFTRAQAAMSAGDKARADEAARSAEEQRKAAEAKAGRTAELQVLAERENGVALAGVALLAGLVAGAAAFWFHVQGKRPARTRAAIAAARRGCAWPSAATPTPSWAPSPPTTSSPTTTRSATRIRRDCGVPATRGASTQRRRRGTEDLRHRDPFA